MEAPRRSIDGWRAHLGAAGRAMPTTAWQDTSAAAASTLGPPHCAPRCGRSNVPEFFTFDGLHALHLAYVFVTLLTLAVVRTGSFTGRVTQTIVSGALGPTHGCQLAFVYSGAAVVSA